MRSVHVVTIRPEEVRDLILARTEKCAECADADSPEQRAREADRDVRGS